MTEFKPTHILKIDVKILYFNNSATKEIQPIDEEVEIIFSYDDDCEPVSLVVTETSCPILVRNSDLVEIKNEPKVPVIDGFELVEIEQTGDSLYYTLLGERYILSNINRWANFAGYVYEESETMIRPISRRFQHSGKQYNTFKPNLGDYELLLPKWVAFTK